MKTPEEIKSGLECWANDSGCTGSSCPYGGILACEKKIGKDALEYINELEARISLMLIQMRGDCGVCKHRNEWPSEGSPCNKCAVKDGHPLWEYEGLPELSKK